MRSVRWIVATAVGLVVGAGPPALAGGGGGGCSEPLISAAGAVVEMRRACFTPAIVRVRPGTTVTFVNREGLAHNVIGAHGRWGTWEELGLDDSFTRTFKEPGVFPFACAFHPGMMGAVVVGRGLPVETVFLPPPAAPAGALVDGKAAPPIVPDPPMRVATSALSRGWRPAALFPWGVAVAAVAYGIAQRRRARRARA